MANTQISSLLMFVCILCLQTTKGVDGQCTTPPINVAVYEETKNISMMCNSPAKVSWTFKPTTDELTTYSITKYDDVVLTSLKNLFGVNSSSLFIKTGQGVATVAPISTAGLYIILINGSTTTKYGAKLTVVRQPPTCNCTAVNSTKITITCSLSYADSSLHPINATMTWTSDGDFYKNDTPVRKKSGAYYVSTSTITVDSFYAANYQCTVTFGKSYNVQYTYVATNAPAFSASCTPPFCGDIASAPPTSTTQPPTTETPATQPPATQPPTTQPPTTQPPTTQPPTIQPPTTQPPATQPPATQPPATQPPATQPPATQPPATQPPATQPPASDLHSAAPLTECNCTETKACSSPDPKCIQTKECVTDGTNLTGIYSECVVKAELYVRSNSCCSDALICGVVVTIRNNSRWLIHDPQCDDNKCEMVIIDASCMSNDWKLFAERNIVKSGVGDYVQVGNYIVRNVTDCSESCQRLMNLP